VPFLPVVIFTPLPKARLCKTISYCYRYVLGSPRRVVS